MQTYGNRHITYCTNIHPGGDWEQTWESLSEFLPRIKSAIAPSEKFGVGLRLSNTASEELGTGHRLENFRQWLNDNGLYVFTMNGFPYGNFHREPVKDKVHAPDWTTSERLMYTKRLFTQLAHLLPKGQAGGISTSPVSYKHWFGTEAEKEKALKKGAAQMSALIVHLYQLERDKGCFMHLDIEPEPDGLLENSAEVVSYFREYLEPIGISYLSDALSLSREEARDAIYRYITVCYDICHFSLAYEAPARSLALFESAGIKVGKIQVSAALKIRFGPGNKKAVWDSLAQFNEPVYLHQVTRQQGDEVITYPDLPEVLETKGDYNELRAHFHVPIFLEEFGELTSTQDQILQVLEYLKDHHVTDHLEIETYTWEVLPKALKKPMAESIVRELNWLKEQMQYE